MVSAEKIAMPTRVAIKTGGKVREARAKRFWLAAMMASGLGGIGSGISGLLLSFLAAEGMIPASSSVRLIVPILIVVSLTLMMCAAHSLDRLNSLKK